MITFKDYQDHGFNLIPVPAGKKLTYMKWSRYKHKSYTDPILLPDNAALMCGSIGDKFGNGVCCIDEDKKWFKPWAAQQPGGQEELDTLWSEDTPSGGKHYFCILDWDLFDKTDQKATLNKTMDEYGFETFMHSHLVIITPSRLDDGTGYTNVKNPFILKPMPKFIKDAILLKHPQGSGYTKGVCLENFAKDKQNIGVIMQRTNILKRLENGEGRRQYILWGFGQALAYNYWTEGEVLTSAIIELLAEQGYPDLRYPEIKLQIIRGLRMVTSWTAAKLSD